MSVSSNNIPKLFLIFQRDVSQPPGTWRQDFRRLSAQSRAAAILEHFLPCCISPLFCSTLTIHPYVYTSCHSCSLQFCFLLWFLSYFALARVTIHIYTYMSCPHYLSIFILFLWVTHSFVITYYFFLWYNAMFFSISFWTFRKSFLRSYLRQFIKIKCWIFLEHPEDEDMMLLRNVHIKLQTNMELCPRIILQSLFFRKVALFRL